MKYENEYQWTDRFSYINNTFGKADGTLKLDFCGGRFSEICHTNEEFEDLSRKAYAAAMEYNVNPSEVENPAAYAEMMVTEEWDKGNDPFAAIIAATWIFKQEFDYVDIIHHINKLAFGNKYTDKEFYIIEFEK